MIAITLATIIYMTLKQPDPMVPIPNPAAVPRLLEMSASLTDSEKQTTDPADSLEEPASENDNADMKNRVINIGEPMDPDDSSTWPQSDDTEVISIGESMDPDDPSTWPQSDDTEVISIGESMNPDDPSTWPQSDDTEVISIGESMNPDDPSTWPQSDDTEVINIGEPMDPDDASTWPQQ